MLVTTDNKILKLTDNHQSYKPNLKLIANKAIKDLVDDNPNLLVFPEHLKINDDDIEKECIFELSDNTLTTSNIMGFVGINDTYLKIQSRFAQGNTDNDEDYFLHYMLQKVFCVNLFDLKHSQNTSSLFDFLVYLFPYFLKKALSQGLYKAYHKQHHNDANIKGAIDISSHIKNNIPFRGNVAYTLREHSYNNSLTQLIRHTIELIKQKKVMRNVLHTDSDTQNAVNLITQHTPSYHARDRYTVINKNLKPFVHPYFYEYVSLQNICMQILRYEGLKYADNDDKAHGILFDGAWLWEEYLNTLLKGIGFMHPQNKKSKGGIKVYADKITGNNVSRFPDFIFKEEKNKHTVVLDAKYKWMKQSTIGRNDLNQIISYMYLYKADTGGFIAPATDTNSEMNVGILNGYGGSIHKFKLGIPQSMNSYDNFVHTIEHNERLFIESIVRI